MRLLFSVVPLLHPLIHILCGYELNDNNKPVFKILLLNLHTGHATHVTCSCETVVICANYEGFLKVLALFLTLSVKTEQ